MMLLNIAYLEDTDIHSSLFKVYLDQLDESLHLLAQTDFRFSVQQCRFAVNRVGMILLLYFCGEQLKQSFPRKSRFSVNISVQPTVFLVICVSKEKSWFSISISLDVPI